MIVNRWKEVLDDIKETYIMLDGTDRKGVLKTKDWCYSVAAILVLAETIEKGEIKMIINGEEVKEKLKEGIDLV